jgi:hypothetical protein
VVEGVPAAIAPLLLLKWLFNRTIAPIPAAEKSAFSGSSTQPTIRICKAAVVAIVLIARRPNETPVASVPVIAVEKLALANTAARAVALLVHDASALDHRLQTP